MMSMGRSLLLCWAVLGIGSLGWGDLRAEGEAAEIIRVKIEEYVASKPVRTEDPTIRFERRYLSWGAIDSQEYRDREGKYYAVFWKVKEPGAKTVVCLEYLQSKTGRTVHRQEVVIDQPRRGTNVVEFQVTGPLYHENGDVLAWKASIVRDGVVLADKRSFLWKDP